MIFMKVIKLNVMLMLLELTFKGLYYENYHLPLISHFLLKFCTKYNNILRFIATFETEIILRKFKIAT